MRPGASRSIFLGSTLLLTILLSTDFPSSVKSKILLFVAPTFHSDFRHRRCPNRKEEETVCYKLSLDNMEDVAPTSAVAAEAIKAEQPVDDKTESEMAENVAKEDPDVPNTKDDKDADSPNATTTTTTNNNNNISSTNDRHWDTTSKKVVVHNVLKFMRNNELKKLVSSWLDGHEHLGIKIIKTKKPPRDNWVKVTLETEEMVEPFIQLINGKSSNGENGGGGGGGGEAKVNRRGKALYAMRASERDLDNSRGGRNGRDDNEGGSHRKRKERDDDSTAGSGDRKRGKSEGGTRILTSDEVRDAVTPLWRMSYEEQLDMKWKEMVKKCAMKICQEVKGKFRILEKEARRNKQHKNVPQVYDWVATKRAIEVERPVPSPKKYEYRNKCEFTAGYLHSIEGSDQVRLEDGSKVVKVDEADDGKVDEMEVVDTTGEETKDMKVEDSSEPMKMEEGEKATDEDGADAVKEDSGDDAGKDKESDNDLNATKAEAREAATNDASAPAEESTESKKDELPTAVIHKTPAAGFLAQGWHGGVYLPHCLENMPDWSCGLADIFNKFLPTSPMPPYDSKVHRGVWRTFTLRCSLRTRECLVIVQHAPASGGAGAQEDGSDDYSAVFEKEKQRLVKMLTEGVIPTTKRDYPEGHVKEVVNESGKDRIKVTSIFFQEYDGLSHPTPEHPVQHVFGKTSLEEKLGQCTFQISPGAFFQTNTEGAEKLYSIVVERIKEVTKNPKQTLLLDVCCGTGTIGMTCLKEGVVGRLVGVDISEPAIADAKINAEKNGWTTEENTETKSSEANSPDKTMTRFVASRAETVLPDEMKNIARSTPIVAVVDPARDGLHGVVVKTIRINEKIQRLVYVSCNPTGTLVRDAAMLCAPPTKRYPGRPFKIVRAQPVDMFPLTSHCEMVMTFERMSEEEVAKSQRDQKGEKRN